MSPPAKPALPELPKQSLLHTQMPDHHWYGSVYGYTVDQMREYARAAIDAAVTEARGVPERLLQALRFYARGEHYITDDDEEFDTVSGEPDNWLCSGLENSSTMIESGGIARRALLGQTLNWIYDDEDQTPQPIEGEALSATPSPTEPAMLNGLTEDETAATASVAGLSSAEPAMPAERTCVECGGPLQWRCPACRIAQSKDVAAPPQLAEGERALAARLADWGSDAYELQPAEISDAKKDMRAAADLLDSQAAELAALRASAASVQADQRAELDRLRSAIVWALGASGEFRPQGTMDGKYWWRGELAERAGLSWDGVKYIDAALAAKGEGA